MIFMTLSIELVMQFYIFLVMTTEFLFSLSYGKYMYLFPVHIVRCLWISIALYSAITTLYGEYKN